MSAPSTTAQALTQAADNQFELHDHHNKTQVTLTLGSHGPLIKGETNQGPSMSYQGAEGTFNVSGPQVAVETTGLGTFYTITLNVVPDARSESFSLLLPSVTHSAAGQKQNFETLGIKSDHHLALIGALPPGANVSYSVLKLQGTAATVEIAD